MIPFDEMSAYLKRLGKDRAWLVAASGRSAGAVRSALAPNAAAQHRSELLQKALSDALEREEAEQAMQAQPISPGFKNVFMDDEQLSRADRASRAINSPSLAEFCRQAIVFRANEILAGNADPVPVDSKLRVPGKANGTNGH